MDYVYYLYKRMEGERASDVEVCRQELLKVIGDMEEKHLLTATESEIIKQFLALRGPEVIPLDLNEITHIKRPTTTTTSSSSASASSSASSSSVASSASASAGAAEEEDALPPFLSTDEVTEMYESGMYQVLNSAVKDRAITVLVGRTARKDTGRADLMPLSQAASPLSTSVGFDIRLPTNHAARYPGSWPGGVVRK